MQQRLTFITLGVDDLEAMTKFYCNQFGWTPMMANEGIAMFRLNGIVLSLYSAKELAEDITITDDGAGFKRMTMAINFSSEEEVNAAFIELAAQGVRVVKAPAKVFWGGYSGYVADIENNYWELAHNPFLAMDMEGNVIDANEEEQ